MKILKIISNTILNYIKYRVRRKEIFMINHQSTTIIYHWTINIIEKLADIQPQEQLQITREGKGDYRE